MDHQQFVDTIIGLDEDIRFATVCNMSGKMEATKQRDGVEKYLTLEETAESLKHAANAWIFSRTPHFKKIGKGLYTLSAYEKLKRVTVPLEDGFLLLATMDNTGEISQILDKILGQVHGAKS